MSPLNIGSDIHTFLSAWASFLLSIRSCSPSLFLQAFSCTSCCLLRVACRRVHRIAVTTAAMTRRRPERIPSSICSTPPPKENGAALVPQCEERSPTRAEGGDVKLFHEALDPTASVGKIPNGSDRAAGVPAQAEMPQTNRPRSRKAGPALSGQSRDVTHRELGRAGSPFGTRGKLLRHGNPLEQPPMKNTCRSIHVQEGHSRSHKAPSSLRCRLQPSKYVPCSSGGEMIAC